MKNLTTNIKWRRLRKWLRENFPASHILVIDRKSRITTQKQLCGYCDFKTKPYKHYYIYIDRKQVFALQLDTLLHEVAHALTWHGNDEDDHGPEWGLAYAKIYRSFLEWNYGEPHDDE